MPPSQLRQLLSDIAAGRIAVDAALDRLAVMPFESFAVTHAVGQDVRLDHHRAIRCGFPEVVFGQGKTAAQITEIVSRLTATSDRVLATRVDSAAASAVLQRVPDAVYHTVARTITWRASAAMAAAIPPVAVLCAGTADIPVAEEARITLEIMDVPTVTHYDVGVAGLHRVLATLDDLRRTSVVIVVAGMEGALPSVVGGLVATPVIAVPTSVGYGASFGGLAALLAMLNTCAAGVSVVNIDNGFGAGYQAAMIVRAGIPRAGG